MSDLGLARRAATRLILGALLACAGALAVAWPAAADGSCRPAYRTLATDAEMSAFVCQKVAEETIHGPAGPIHVTYWRRKKDNPGAYPAALEPLRLRVASTFHRAVDPYEAFAPLPSDIAVVIGEGLGPWQHPEFSGVTDEEFEEVRNSEQCAIDLNMNNLHFGWDEAGYRHFVDWVAAHELFHCLEALNFPAQWQYGTRKFQRWWLEGMAEYFPALVLHDHPVFYEWERFAAQSAKRPLFELGFPSDHGYQTAPFFAYLDGPRFGSRRMFEIWKSMPLANSWDVQLVHFQATHLGEPLQNFAKAVADQSIPTRVPGMPTYGLVDAIGQAIQVDLGDAVIGFARDRAKLALIRDGAAASRESFHIYRGRAILAQGYRYEITPVVGPNTRLSFRQEEGTWTWVDAPNVLKVDACRNSALITATATSLEINPRVGPYMRLHRTACNSGAHVDPCDLAPPSDIEGIVGAPLGGEGSFRRPGAAFDTCHLEPRMKFAQRFKNPKDPTATPGHRERENVRSVSITMIPPQLVGKLGVDAELKMAAGSLMHGPAWAPNPPLEQIRGLGDKAYYAGTLAVFYRGWLISVSVEGPDNITNSGPDDKAQEIAIARLLLSNFPPPSP